ncbi:MAG: hypothetical protein N4A57_05190 [Anaeromicrobium sp.]|jgi:protein AbiQ|uniref:hypothetical protein n=1 Tax=Anaeromicrobium sp. TaxID=1929132 RepID=UPI0025EBE265|nr:hypothetical protein [Anaeromicrobium sp.]MCT4593648.1 hypothetical protein [Anaeromicrobium sp.]
MSQMACKVVFIKEDFFKKNEHFVEILDPYDTKKQAKRNYAFLNVKCQNNNIFVPLRSKFNPNQGCGVIGYPVPTNNKPNAGLDFRKILIVNELSYIEFPSNPKIPNMQQKIINEKYKTIENMVIQYIKGYMKSALKKREKRDKKYRFSTLHNFHNELGIVRALEEKEITEKQIATIKED